MKNDISAIGNALVDTVFKVEHSLISELGLEIDQMTLSSAEEHAPIIERLIASGAETVSDCGGSATNSLVAASSFGAKCFHTCKVADDIFPLWPIPASLILSRYLMPSWSSATLQV